MPPIPIPMPTMRVRFARAGSKRNSEEPPVAASSPMPDRVDAARTEQASKAIEMSSPKCEKGKEHPTPSTSRTESGWNGRTFPFVLHGILSREEYKQYITWMPSGKAWSILDMSKFAEVVCPKFFRHSNYRSFMQNVRNWDFTQLVDDDGRIAYYHDLFTKGDPSKCRHMKRVSKQSKLKSDIKDAADGIMHLSGGVNSPVHRPASSASSHGATPTPVFAKMTVNEQSQHSRHVYSPNANAPQQCRNPHISVRQGENRHVHNSVPMQIDPPPPPNQKQHRPPPPGTRVIYHQSSNGATPGARAVTVPVVHKPPHGPMTQHPPQSHYTTQSGAPPQYSQTTTQAGPPPPPQQHIIVHHHHHPVVIQQSSQREQQVSNNDSVYSLMYRSGNGQTDDDDEKKKAAASYRMSQAPPMDPLQLERRRRLQDNQRDMLARIQAQNEEERKSLELAKRLERESMNSYSIAGRNQPQTVIHEVHHHHPTPYQSSPQTSTQGASSLQGYSVKEQQQILAEIQAKRAADEASLALARSLQYNGQHHHVPPPHYHGNNDPASASGQTSNGDVVMEDMSQLR